MSSQSRSRAGAHDRRRVRRLALAVGGLVLAGSAEARDARPPVLRQVGISDADYPETAIAAGIEGTTVVQVDVDASGGATACRVVASSESSILDDFTCKAAMTRMEFSPGADTRGRPVGGTVRLPVAWRLPERPSLPDRFRVTYTVDRLADGTLANCRLADAPSEDACDVWRGGAGGPAAFARTYRPGEALRLTFAVDVRPWTGSLQPVAPPGGVEQAVLLGGEETDSCARLGEDGPVMRGWEEITACPPVSDPAAFFATLGDPRPRQSTWTLAAEPVAR